MKTKKFVKALIDVKRGLSRLTVWGDCEGFHIKTRFGLGLGDDEPERNRIWALCEDFLVGRDRAEEWLQLFEVKGLGKENDFLSRIRYFGAHDMLLKSKKYAWSIIIRNEEANQVSDLIRLYFGLKIG